MKTYGYVRVSSRDQNEARQIMAMKEAGLRDEDIFVDKFSGKDFNRPAWQRLLSVIQKDDLILVKSIDRLGRNYEEILEQWRLLTKVRGADISVMDMPLLDTRRGKDLMGTFMSDIVLQILSFVAENERSNIRARQAEGIRAAHERGVRFGRPKTVLPDNFSRVCESFINGEMNAVEASEACHMATSTFYKYARDLRCGSGGTPFFP